MSERGHEKNRKCMRERGTREGGGGEKRTGDKRRKGGQEKGRGKRTGEKRRRGGRDQRIRRKDKKGNIAAMQDSIKGGGEKAKQ